jgi:hypothetical protein
MKVTLLVLALTLFTPACSTTREAAESLQSSYIGVNIDEFVLKHGPPHTKHELNSGDLMYVWSSRVKSFTRPATTTVQGTVSPQGYSGTASTSGGGTYTVFCEVQILTSGSGTIKSISPVHDSLGDWQLSRCAEIFRN